MLRPLASTCSVLVIIRLERRNLVWINVTRHPTAEWMSRQVTEAFPWAEASTHLIRLGEDMARIEKALGYGPRDTRGNLHEQTHQRMRRDGKRIAAGKRRKR